jgi:N-acetylmuramoyl-L-alanine amidase
LAFTLAATGCIFSPADAWAETRRAVPVTTTRQNFATDSPPSVKTTKGRKTTTTQSRPSTIVVIDPGHGGFDRGGIPGQRVSEKTMTLDVGLRLRAVLQNSGYRVAMTRDSDVFVPLGNRIGIANSYRDAIFVCIHFNSATRRGANGVETYFYNRDSLALASAIHYFVARAAPTPNRGVRRRGYYVLRRARVPAVLVECGFLTNPTEAENAQSGAYRQRLAEEIAHGIGARSLVGTTVGPTRVATSESVPLQPFIDQTRVRDPDLSRSKRSSKKSSKRKSSASKSRKATSGEADSGQSSSTKKKRSKKRSDTSEEQGTSRKKKATED